jgi:hypothetical protein
VLTTPKVIAKLGEGAFIEEKSSREEGGTNVQQLKFTVSKEY